MALMSMHGCGYGGYRNRYRYGYGKRGMKMIASRKRANNVEEEINDDAGIEHLKENFAGVERQGPVKSYTLIIQACFVILGGLSKFSGD